MLNLVGQHVAAMPKQGAPLRNRSQGSGVQGKSKQTWEIEARQLGSQCGIKRPFSTTGAMRSRSIVEGVGTCDFVRGQSLPSNTTVINKVVVVVVLFMQSSLRW